MEAIPTPPSFFDNTEERDKYAQLVNACWKACWNDHFEYVTKEPIPDKVAEKLRLEGFVVGEPYVERKNVLTKIEWRK